MLLYDAAAPFLCLQNYQLTRIFFQLRVIIYSELSFSLTHTMTLLPEGFGASLDTLQALDPGAQSADLSFKLHLALVNLLAHAGEDGHHLPARTQISISFTHHPHALIHPTDHMNQYFKRLSVFVCRSVKCTSCHRPVDEIFTQNRCHN